MHQFLTLNKDHPQHAVSSIQGFTLNRVSGVGANATCGPRELADVSLIQGRNQTGKLHTINSSSKKICHSPRFGLWFYIEGKTMFSLKTQLKKYLNTSSVLQFRSSSLSDSFYHFCDILFFIRLEPGIFIQTKISTKTQTFDRNKMSDRTSNVKCLIKFQY